MTDDRQIWKDWEWPWKDKKRTAQQQLVGLGRMHDRLMRKHVWVYQGPEKYKPALRNIKIVP
tara:strand:- start:384 stop:569 length:186 start_codon:yes stop_codon:yes gene_type:complete